MNYVHDPLYRRLIVGRPDENTVTLITQLQQAAIHVTSSAQPVAPGQSGTLTASLTLDRLAPGAHTLMVTYSGDLLYQQSSAGLAQELVVFHGLFLPVVRNSPISLMYFQPLMIRGSMPG